jgi:hypothetical protein
MSDYEWIEAPEQPDAEATERLRAVCREEPRIVELWISGGRWTDDDGILWVYTAFDLVLDSVEEADRDAARVEIVPKLEAAWAPSGLKSVRFLTGEILTPPLKRRCLPIYTQP